MARGYPSPKPVEAPAPVLVEQGTCIICKKRPARAGQTKCATCEALLKG